MICGELYVIDLTTNHQYQKTNPTRRRRIMRNSVAETQKKGIAGLLKSSGLPTRDEI